MKLFLISVRILINSVKVSSSSAIVVVKRPINSGIIPKRVKSSGVIFFKLIGSFLDRTTDPNPMADTPVLLRIISSNPTKAPPAMNSMFFVSTSINSPCGCLRLPAGLTRHLVPSTNLSNACCTPSPDTSRVILALSLFLAILSTSSINTIPLSARLTS